MSCKKKNESIFFFVKPLKPGGSQKAFFMLLCAVSHLREGSRQTHLVVQAAVGLWSQHEVEMCFSLQLRQFSPCCTSGL